MILTPCAKINIGLYVTEKRADGYHNLETVFYPIPLCDELELRPLRGSDAPWRLQLAGAPVAGAAADNLVVRVCESLRADFDGLPGVDIYLKKRIPTGAGLGGGSSDATYMMRGMNELFGLGLSDDEMEARLARLGADCPFFVRSRPAFATGIGDILTPLPLSLRGRTLLLVKPDDFVSTREAYAGVTPRRPAHDLRESIARPVEEWRTCVANDFEASVFAAHPRIAAIKQTLYDMGATYAAMSGSGSAVFGLFDRRIDEATSVFADCFVFQTLLREDDRTASYRSRGERA